MKCRNCGVEYETTTDTVYPGICNECNNKIRNIIIERNKPIQDK